MLGYVLGYNISGGGISADSSKIDAIKGLLIPNDVGSLRSFLRLASYYRRFVSGFSKVAETTFCCPYQEGCNLERCDKAFQQLKTLLTSALLIFPISIKKFS